jgi:hypothetical protein
MPARKRKGVELSVEEEAKKEETRKVKLVRENAGLVLAASIRVEALVERNKFHIPDHIDQVRRKQTQMD